MTRHLSVFLSIVGLLCTLAASDFATFAKANVLIAASVEAELPAVDGARRIASLEEAFPSAESALAAAEAATRLER